jgi:hypothetical protein
MEILNPTFINNAILLIILLLLANYLSNGSILNILNKYYDLLIQFINKNVFGSLFENFINERQHSGFDGKAFEGIKKCMNTTSDIMHDNDFKYIYNARAKTRDIHKENDPVMRKLYFFLQSLVTVNKNYDELTVSRDIAHNLTQAENDTIRKFFNKSLDCKDFKFTNLQILDKLVYYENPRGKELRPFRIEFDAYYKNEPIGTFTIYIEMYIKFDDLFYGPIKTGFPSITRIKLLNRSDIDSPDGLDNEDNSEEELNHTDNSLIPNTIDFSENEKKPKNKTSDLIRSILSEGSSEVSIETPDLTTESS